MLCRYAWYKLFNLAKTYNKNLSIPPYEPAESARTEAEVELEKDRSVRMATILGFSVVSQPALHNLTFIHSKYSFISSLIDRLLANPFLTGIVIDFAL